MNSIKKITVSILLCFVSFSVAYAGSTVTVYNCGKSKELFRLFNSNDTAYMFGASEKILAPKSSSRLSCATNNGCEVHKLSSVKGLFGTESYPSGGANRFDKRFVPKGQEVYFMGPGWYIHKPGAKVESDRAVACNPSLAKKSAVTPQTTAAVAAGLNLTKKAATKKQTYYYLTNKFLGNNKVMALDNKNRLFMSTKSANNDRQKWTVIKDKSGWYHLTNKALGTDISMDSGKDKPHMAKTGNYTGQQWRFTSVPGGWYRLSNNYQGLNKVLDTYNAKGNYLFLENKAKNTTGTFWKKLMIAEPR